MGVPYMGAPVDQPWTSSPNPPFNRTWLQARMAAVCATTLLRSLELHKEDKSCNAYQKAKVTLR